MPRRTTTGLLFLFLILTLFSACTPDSSADETINQPEEDKGRSNIESVLNSNLRIDIKSSNIEFDYNPDQYTVKGKATIQFIMRTGQKTPLIHFNPGVRDINCISLIKLNGEELNIHNDVIVKEFKNSQQRALEFQRTLEEKKTQTLYMEYDLRIIDERKIFKTKSFNMIGRGNEELFPTINSPGELIEHEIKFRNSGSTRLRIVGSGTVTENRESKEQEWTLKPERPIASHTIMFVLAPESEMDYQEKTINDIKVKMMGWKNENKLNATGKILTRVLPQYIGYFGSFPATEGLSVFIESGYGGTEYYGGCITANDTLEQKLLHLWFGCSVIAKTYRDSWLFEGITSWNRYTRYSEIYGVEFFLGPIHDDYSSDIVSGRSPVDLGYDNKAYHEGARIIAAVANELGVGRGQPKETLMKFLKYLYDENKFKPITTMDFVDCFKSYSGVDMEKRFQQWLYTNSNQ